MMVLRSQNWYKIPKNSIMLKNVLTCKKNGDTWAEPNPIQNQGTNIIEDKNGTANNWRYAEDLF